MPSMTQRLNLSYKYVLRARLKFSWPQEFGVSMSVGWRTVIGKTTGSNVQLNKYLLKTNNYFQPNPSDIHPSQYTILFSFLLVILLHGLLQCFIPCFYQHSLLATILPPLLSFFLSLSRSFSRSHSLYVKFCRGWLTRRQVQYSALASVTTTSSSMATQAA